MNFWRGISTHQTRSYNPVATRDSTVVTLWGSHLCGIYLPALPHWCDARSSGKLEMASGLETPPLAKFPSCIGLPLFCLENNKVKTFVQRTSAFVQVTQ